MHFSPRSPIAIRVFDSAKFQRLARLAEDAEDAARISIKRPKAPTTRTVRAANSRRTRTIKPSKLVRTTKIDFRFPSRARVLGETRRVSLLLASSHLASPRDTPRLLSSMPRTTPPPPRSIYILSHTLARNMATYTL